MKKNQKSFAERAQEILKRYEGRTDPISKRSKISDLANLKREQEYVKAEKQLADGRQNLQKGMTPDGQFAYGGDIPPVQIFNNDRLGVAEPSTTLTSPHLEDPIDQNIIAFNDDIKANQDFLKTHPGEQGIMNNISGTRSAMETYRNRRDGNTPGFLESTFGHIKEDFFAYGGEKLEIDYSVIPWEDPTEAEMATDEAEMDTEDLNYAASQNLGMDYSALDSEDGNKRKAPYYKPADNPMRYAGIAGNLMNYLNVRKPSANTYNKLSPKNNDPYKGDRNAMINNIDRGYNTARSSLGNAQGNWRQMASANAALGINRDDAIYKGLAQMDLMDAKNEQVANQRNDRFDMFNEQNFQKTQDMNKADQAAYDHAKSTYSTGMFSNLAGIGEEQLNRMDAVSQVNYYREMGLSEAAIASLVEGRKRKDAYNSKSPQINYGSNR